MHENDNEPRRAQMFVQLLLFKCLTLYLAYNAIPRDVT